MDGCFHLADYFKISPFSFGTTDYREFVYMFDMMQDIISKRNDQAQDDKDGVQDISSLF